MRMKKITVLCGIFSAGMILSSCVRLHQPGKSERRNSVSVLNWNLQTFFDGNFDGGEYYEFSNSKSGWNGEKYAERLERLAKVVKSGDFDVVVMEELERKEQLYDIYNRLCSNFNFSKNYSYGAFAKSAGSSIGCGILSRFPLAELRTHELDVRTESENQPNLRPIMSVKIIAGEKPLELIVNHWKSKSRGSTSEIWRKKQEAVLAELFVLAEAENLPALACGDFNMDISEFERIQNAPGVNVRLLGKKSTAVFSPWLDARGELSDSGSYFYRERWERIDHFFSNAAAEVSEFAVLDSGEWARADGTPYRYKAWDGSGFSDHFPIYCVVSW